MSKLKKSLIVAVIILGFIFWPLGIGALIAWPIYKFIKNNKIRYSLIALFLVPAFLINAIWTQVLVSPSSIKKEESPKTQEQVVTLPSPVGAVAGIQAENLPSSTPSPIPSEEPKIPAKVISVTDGDTLKVSINGKTENIRVIGINTPETVDPRKPVECMGQEASRMAKLYFEDTKDIWLEADPTQGDRDKYQRLLRYIWTDDATVDYGKVIISLGYANEYTYQTPYKYQELYKQAQKEAQEGKKGLWADDACAKATPTPKPVVKAPLTKPVTTPKAAATVSQTNPAPQTTTPTSGGDKNCDDFSTHAEAQAYFNSKGGSSSNNVDGLDRDRDGIACETLP